MFHHDRQFVIMTKSLWKSTGTIAVSFLHRYTYLWYVHDVRSCDVEDSVVDIYSILNFASRGLSTNSAP